MDIKNDEWKSDLIKARRAKGYSEANAVAYAENFIQGYLEGMAKVLLIVLEVRGIEATGETRERVTSCTDTDQLACWVKLAAVAGKMEEVFG